MTGLASRFMKMRAMQSHCGHDFTLYRGICLMVLREMTNSRSRQLGWHSRRGLFCPVTDPFWILQI